MLKNKNFQLNITFKKVTEFPPDTRILITGITSIHGWSIYKKLKSILPKHSLYGVRSPKMKVPDHSNVKSICITDRNEMKKIKNTFSPTLVIHCAGVCDLDVCEERPEWADKLNCEGASVVSKIFGDNSHIIYLSTDLVFSGEHFHDRGYTESDIPDPVSIVGKTFVKAEKIISKNKNFTIIRLGLPIGHSVKNNNGAWNWVENRFKKKLPVTLFSDEFRSCISCDFIGEIVVKLLQQKSLGLFHLGGDTSINLHELGKYIIKVGNYNSTLLKSALTKNEKNGPPRITNVTLNSSKLKSIL